MILNAGEGEAQFAEGCLQWQSRWINGCFKGAGFVFERYVGTGDAIQAAKAFFDAHLAMVAAHAIHADHDMMRRGLFCWSNGKTGCEIG